MVPSIRAVLLEGSKGIKKALSLVEAKCTHICGREDLNFHGGWSQAALAAHPCIPLPTTSPSI